MFHCVGFFKAVGSGIASNADYMIDAVIDAYVRVERGFFYPQKPLKLYSLMLQAGVFNSGLSRYWVDSDEFRNLGPQYLAPATNCNDSVCMDDIILPKPEQMRGLIPHKQYAVYGHTVGSGAIINDIMGSMLIGDGNFSYPSGEVWTARFTLTYHRADGVWTQYRMTPADILPKGTYAVIGGVLCPRDNTTGGVFWRLWFQNQENKPGSWGMLNRADSTPTWPRYGGLGLWGQFNETSIPTIEFLPVSGSFTGGVDVFLDLVRLR